MREIEFQNRSEKFISKLEKVDRERVAKGLEILRQDPIPGPPKVLQLREYPGLSRMKVGAFRVIFSIQEPNLRVVLVDMRGDDRVYDRLQRLFAN